MTHATVLGWHLYVRSEVPAMLRHDAIADRRQCHIPVAAPAPHPQGGRSATAGASVMLPQGDIEGGHDKHLLANHTSTCTDAEASAGRARKHLHPCLLALED